MITDYKDFNIYYYITGNSVFLESIQDNIVTGQIISINFFFDSYGYCYTDFV
jgi:hypothetical protein